MMRYRPKVSPKKEPDPAQNRIGLLEQKENDTQD